MTSQNAARLAASFCVRALVWAVDVDQKWEAIGLSGLLTTRMVRLLTVEVDGSWGELLEPWNVSEVDRLAWLARRHGYETHLKVPCTRARGFSHRFDGRSSAWLLELASPRRPFAPSGYHVVRRGGFYEIQDLVLVDARERAASDALRHGGRTDCMSAHCQRTACAAPMFGGEEPPPSPSSDVARERAPPEATPEGAWDPASAAGKHERAVRACLECIRSQPKA